MWWELIGFGKLFMVFYSHKLTILLRMFFFFQANQNTNSNNNWNTCNLFWLTIQSIDEVIKTDESLFNVTFFYHKHKILHETLYIWSYMMDVINANYWWNINLNQRKNKQTNCCVQSVNNVQYAEWHRSGKANAKPVFE